LAKTLLLLWLSRNYDPLNKFDHQPPTALKKDASQSPNLREIQGIFLSNKFELQIFKKKRELAL
jgi:hypothetical protein